MTETEIRDYLDERGVHRRVLIPAGSSVDPAEGIPASLDLEALYPHMPLVFVDTLTNALWDQGLIEPQDFLTGSAPERIRAALLSVVRHDTMSIISYAKEHLYHA